MGATRQHLAKVVGPEHAQRVHFLMDFRANRARYEAQLAEAGAKPLAMAAAKGPATDAPCDDDDAGE
jgi:hypothetical protein